MSESRAKALRKAQGGLKRKQKSPTPLLERSYIQSPVGWDSVANAPRYRSGKQVRRFLEKRGVDVDALAAELQSVLDQQEAVQA